MIGAGIGPFRAVWGAIWRRDKFVRWPFVRHKCWGNLAMQQVTLAASTLLGYTLGLRPRPNTPGTHQVWGTYALLRLAHLPFLQKCCMGGLAVQCSTALVTGKLADYTLGLQPRPHTTRDPSGPKTTRTSAFVGSGLVCKEATLQRMGRAEQKKNPCFQLHIYAALSYFRSYSRPHTPGTHHFLEHPRPAGFAALQTAFWIESR